MPTVCLALLSQSQFSKGFQQHTSIPFTEKNKQHKAESRAGGRCLPWVLATGACEVFSQVRWADSDSAEHFQPLCSALWTLGAGSQDVSEFTILALGVKPTWHLSIERLQRHHPHRCFSFSFRPAVWADASLMLAVTQAFSHEFWFWFSSWTSRYEENSSKRADIFINC